jgi:hypothetical protein
MDDINAVAWITHLGPEQIFPEREYGSCCSEKTVELLVQHRHSVEKRLQLVLLI